MRKLSLLFMFLTISLVTKANTDIKVNNNGFEIINNQLPGNWYFSGSTSVIIDNKTKKEGKNSILFSHNDWNQSTLSSDPVQLTIGHLYKLSGWVKTEEAYSDPLAKYPTAVAGCLTMESQPFTNHSPSFGATKDWQKIESYFFATKKSDQIQLHFGYNGKAKGKVWFDDIKLENVDDITEFIPYETVTWFGNAYRYDDRGWINVHIEGEPYDRGYQYGYLIGKEMVDYINKLAIQENEQDPQNGWDKLRFIADAFMLRKFETEYLTEMKGIAAGANYAGIKLFDKDLDLIDIVTLNSAIDIDAAQGAMDRTANPLTGINFFSVEDELKIPEKFHKCSSFLANKSATTDGRIVFGQLFMWGGYTGPHWNVICDVDPSTGNRLVYETYPGGLHSGADFYINEKGIMIGETTVSQTPFNPDGSPQSNRIRKAAQYANSIDEVTQIMADGNNGMYTNDWMIADTKTNEIAIFLLGTYKTKLWRSSTGEFYGDRKDFYWSNNNNKSLEVRKEYIPNPSNKPYDLAFSPWDRDIEFTKFYDKNKGKIDAINGVNFLATTPINLAHACDGKVTTSDMAENMVFLAHSGKVSLREKFIKETRWIPEKPGATPRLSLGYSVASPIFVTNELRKIKNQKEKSKDCAEGISLDTQDVKEWYSFTEKQLWFNTVYPKSEEVNWFVSGTTAYWEILNKAASIPTKGMLNIGNELKDINNRYLWVTNREGSINPIDAKTQYDGFKNYLIPRIKGTYALHQLRLLIGNELFSKVMNKIHDNYSNKNISTKNIMDVIENVTKRDLEDFMNQWLERDDLPEIKLNGEIKQNDKLWNVSLNVTQMNEPYHLLTTVKITTEKEEIIKKVELKDQLTTLSFEVNDKPLSLEFNPANDFPYEYKDFYSWRSIYDEYHDALIVYGTSKQIEANNTLSQRFSLRLADRRLEILIPTKKDSEVTDEDLANHDLLVLGGVDDNSLMKEIASKLGLEFRKNVFTWRGKTYSASNNGLFAVFANPYNPNKALYIFNTNSAMELYHMTNQVFQAPVWAVFENDRIIDKGYYNNCDLTIKF